MSKGFNFDISKLEKGMASFENKAEAAIKMYAETSALKLQNFARENAVWTDRTGDARKRITGSVLKVQAGYKIYLAHGVNYGIWLELANEKNYAALEPTIALNSQDVLRGMSRLLERLSK